MSKLTQRELAAQLGLSYATVSRVFNGDTRVTEPTRQRVLTEAERLGFRGHPLARALRMKKSFALGVAAANSPHSYWTDVLSALEREARAVGYHVIVSHRETDSGSAAEVRFLVERQVDAVVLSPHPTGEDFRALQEICAGGTPILMLNNRTPGFPCHYIGTDSRTGSREACEHLLGLGHRRIAFVAGPAGDYTAESRLEGYREAMRAAGISGGRRVFPGGWHAEDGERAAQELLTAPERPTAVMTVNDAVAFGVYLALRRAGLRIPDDLSLLGYSGDRAGELLGVPLTTVEQPAERLGRRTAQLVLELIDGKHARPVFEELPDRLLIRESCAAPAPGAA